MRNFYFTASILTLIILLAETRIAFSQTYLSIVSYGATPNDTTDDTGAIKNTISDAENQGKGVYIPAGTFRFTSFRFNGIEIKGKDSTSILYAPDQENSMIIMNGDGATLSNLKVQVNGTSRTGANHGIFVESATNFLICSIEVTGSSSAAILTYKSSFGKIINNYIHNTFSDGIHNTKGSHDIIVANNKVRNTGDDLIACVSYSLPAVRNILIQDNDVAENDWGRGISSIGSSDITIQRNTIGRTGCCAGIIVATESSWTSPPLSNVLIKDNQLSNNSGSSGHGSFLVSGDNENINLVRFEGNTINNPVNYAIKIEGDNNNVAIINNTINDSNNNPITITGGTNTFCSANKLNGDTNAFPTCSGINNFIVTGSTLSYSNKINCTDITTELIKEDNINVISIYPNPTTNSFIVDLASTKVNQIRLINIIGKTVWQQNNTVGNKVIVDTQALPSGIYFLSLITTSHEKAEKKVSVIK